MKVFYTEDQKFEVRPWGGRMCFLATEESAQSKLLGVTAVLRMGQGLTHSTHTHDDCDEIILVLNGEGSQLFQEEDGTAYFISAFCAAICSTSLMFAPTVDIQLES